MRHIFPPDTCDKIRSTTKDTGERFGLAWKMEKHYLPLKKETTTAEFNQMETHFQFSAIEIGGQLTKLDAEVLAVLVQGKELNAEQMSTLHTEGVLCIDLSQISRASCTLGELARVSVSVLGIPQPRAGLATRHSTAALQAAAPAAAPANTSLLSEQDCVAKLGELLLKTTGANSAAKVTDTELDGAFILYSQLLGASPTALSRDWKTGQSVLRALNDLQEHDSTEVFSSIQTRAGYELYIDIIKALCNNNKRKVPVIEIAAEWNRRVREKLEQATTVAQTKKIRQELGLVGAKQVKDHGDRIDMRMTQTGRSTPSCSSAPHVALSLAVLLPLAVAPLLVAPMSPAPGVLIHGGAGVLGHAATMADNLIEICKMVKVNRTEVPEAPTEAQPIPNSLVEGLSGPGVSLMQPSAVQPGANRKHELVQVEAADIKDTCFLCFHHSGKAQSECRVRDQGKGSCSCEDCELMPANYGLAVEGARRRWCVGCGKNHPGAIATPLNGHSRGRHGKLTCKWFDQNFGAGVGREAAIVASNQAKNAAQQAIQRRKKRGTS